MIYGPGVGMGASRGLGASQLARNQKTSGEWKLKQKPNVLKKHQHVFISFLVQHMVLMATMDMEVNPWEVSH